MTKFKKILAFILVAFLYGTTTEIVAQNQTNTIIPKPLSSVVKEGKFQFSSNTKFVVKGEDQKEIANALIAKFQMAAGWKPQLTTKKVKTNYITFKVDKKLNREAYILDISSKSIIISASENAGFIYGLESVRQLLPTAIESKKQIANVDWSVPNGIITDEPRFQWRGLMLDLSRHFFDKSYIMATIDRLAMLKMNILHLHLVDDQGWRIEIKKYPKLTDVGAWRVNQENLAWNARLKVDPDEKGTYGGFLTQEELKEIVKYAQKKNIQIIPEIEMPAHVSCAIAAYPELACFNQRIGVPSGGVWPITDIYCAGKESTFEFLQNVLDEVMTIFPSKYIHIGGDEATKTNWEKCPHCQKRMQEESLKNTHELQSYFVKRIEKYIVSKGKKLIGWDEILEGGLAPEATVMSWQGNEGGIEASKHGHDVIMSPQSHCYFDHYQGPQNDEPIAFGGYSPISKVYDFDPVVKEMSPEQAKYVLGGQANLWSEYIPTTQQSEYMIFPRIAAMSEVLWSQKEARNWSDFTKRLPTLLERYDFLGINYAKSAFLVSSITNANIQNKQLNISLKNEFPNADIRYVLGKGDINTQAIPYKDVITITESTILKASLFQNDRPVGKVYIDSIKFHKAVAKKITFKNAYHKSYQGSSPLSLVDVVRGSKNFHDGQWQAWLVNDMEATIDMDENTAIHQLTLGALESQGSGIYFPIKIQVLLSNDGVNFKEVGQLVRPYAPNLNAEIKDFTINFDTTKARYVKVIATNLKTSPKGDSSFMFFDEILVQ